jgi:streptogramin lyase
MPSSPLRRASGRSPGTRGRAGPVDAVYGNWGSSAIDGETLWASDLSQPRVVRLRAVRSSTPRSISFPVVGLAGTWNVAAGAGGIWATTPRDRAVWRIDPKTNRVTRIAMPHLPSGVSANADEVCVTVRGT